MPDYQPTEPYVIKSGKRAGKSLEMLMFQDYPFLKWWLNELNSKPHSRKNSLHQHLEWLMRQGENRVVLRICPQCNEYPAKFFSSLGNDSEGYAVHSTFTCCDKELCRCLLSYRAAGVTPTIYQIKFSSILKYRKKFDQEMVIKLLRAVHKLPNRLTAKTAFEFFSG